LITSALSAAPSWRALLPTQTLQSASAPKARFLVLTVPSAKMAAQAFRYLMMCARLVRDWLTASARTAVRLVRDPLITSALTATPSWRALLLTKSLQSASVLKARIPVRTVPSAKTAQAFRYLMMCARLVRDWLTTNARTARIWVRDPLITSAFNATTSWRALLPTQTLQSASALEARFLLRMTNVDALTILDGLRALQLTALSATSSY